MVSSSNGKMKMFNYIFIRTNFLSEINVGSNPALTTKLKKDLVIKKITLISVKTKSSLNYK